MKIVIIYSLPGYSKPVKMSAEHKGRRYLEKKLVNKQISSPINCPFENAWQKIHNTAKFTDFKPIMQATSLTTKADQQILLNEKIE